MIVLLSGYILCLFVVVSATADLLEGKIRSNLWIQCPWYGSITVFTGTREHSKLEPFDTVSFPCPEMN